MSGRNKIPGKIQGWLNGLEPQERNKLDFSPESLLPLEQVLLSRFSDGESMYQDEHFEFVRGFLLYGYEVFRRNDLLRHLEWRLPEDEHAPLMPTLICPLFKNSWVNIGKKLPRVLHARIGHVIYDYFNKNTQFFVNKYEEELRAKPQPVPGNGGYSYQYYLLGDKRSFNLRAIAEQLATALAHKPEWQVTFHSPEHLLVSMGNDYYFHFKLDARASVLEESAELADDYQGEKDKARIASCAFRIEFWGDEDDMGDYFNEHLLLLEKLDSDLIYDFRNGLFLDEF
ncbi:hypothetical protein [Motilimonas pumila]|uniref:Uncharacterized protein n=1 Tax=Motilimonas pumila TaxID=2303987 RepID=A0A418Y9F9_9GAMM|nr:hypothetical protein [Motilimonas pumila]RJG37349.1 hypothetical protein D1Z90_19835 [Motilimonas pumila]